MKLESVKVSVYPAVHCHAQPKTRNLQLSVDILQRLVTKSLYQNVFALLTTSLLHVVNKPAAS